MYLLFSFITLAQERSAVKLKNEHAFVEIRLGASKNVQASIIHGDVEDVVAGIDS